METYANVKGQIVIPVELRRKHGITAGTKITIIDGGDVIILKPLTTETLKRMQGALKGSGALKALMDGRRQATDTNA